ncbi:hypothetical protein scyTo_0000117 [Scyliorhinus torazame]|uniref:Uncharacterized protein n=1 Tax=Scyliorhinus torazame TaxID=75743 RepID=A0A401NQL0_SCYTO|nr:hypothetical protein [Scyliorhinus torazame]
MDGKNQLLNYFPSERLHQVVRTPFLVSAPDENPTVCRWDKIFLKHRPENNSLYANFIFKHIFKTLLKTRIWIG